MAQQDPDVDDLVQRLLADPTYHNHPLHEGLALLWGRYRDQLRRLDRIAHLSDHVQLTERRDGQARTAQFEKRLRKLERMTRISDRYQDMLRDMNQALERASTHDLLTDLPNRRLLIEFLRQESARSNRHHTPLAVVLFDIDHFKRVNDRFGHDVGDQTLRTIAHAIRAGVRECDLCGRWGGEEFLLLLPQATMAEAQAMVERILAALRVLSIDGLPDGFRVGISAGLTEYRADERPEDAVSRADVALLAAKRNGRDQVRIE